MKRPRVELVVDELVLIGVDPRDARGIGAAVERAAAERLAALVPDALAPTRHSAARRLDGGRFSVSDRRDVAGYGAGIAGAIVRSVAERKT